ncbi:MAG: glycosyl transferase group 1 [Sphingobacteriales bacterium]|nr:glycosyl transferase group 1 [Sphingobacteriales bacterium]
MKNKIAFISEHASPLAILGGVDSGGQNVYVAELAKHLVKKGYEIDIFTRWENHKESMIINWEPGIRVIHMEAGPKQVIPKEELMDYMHDFTQSMLAFIKRYDLQYDLVHANFWMSGMVACQLKIMENIPFVITFHALGSVRKLYQKEVDKFPEIRTTIETEIVKYADQIIAECPQDRLDLINYYQAPDNKITIIPCGFSKTEFYPVNKNYARKLLNLDLEENIILQLGRMVPRKGIDNVISALARIDQKTTPTRLVVVGGDSNPYPNSSPELKRLELLANQEEVDLLVDFVGRKDRELLKYYYSAADIFITTPWYEPFGITPLEAMACGTPVIGSNVGGVKYTVADGQTGFLVPAKDPDTLAQRIVQLLSDRPLMFNMGAEAIKRVNAEFTWTHVSNKVSDLYQLMMQPSQKHTMLRNSVHAA